MGTDRLCAVLNQYDTSLLQFVPYELKPAHLAEKVYREDSFCPGRDLVHDRAHVQVVGIGIHICKDRSGSVSCNAARRGEECEGRGDHLVALLKVEGHKRENQCISAGGTSDCAFHFKVGGYLLFQTFDFRSQNEVLCLKHPVQGYPYLFPHPVIVSRKVEGRYFILCCHDRIPPCLLKIPYSAWQGRSGQPACSFCHAVSQERHGNGGGDPS